MDDLEDQDETETVRCLICADGPQECPCYGEHGRECMACGGTGEAIPEHCCDCEGSPYCVRCHICGDPCAGNCSCPIPVTRADGSVATI